MQLKYNTYGDLSDFCNFSTKIAFSTPYGSHVHDKEELANHFKKHFSTIAQNLLNKLPYPTSYYSDYLSNANRESIYL